MNMNKRRLLVPVLLSLTMMVSAGFSPVSQAAVLTCPALYKIQQVFLGQHVTYSSMNENLEARTVDQYLKRLDAAKIYLHKSDIAAVKTKMKGLFKQLKDPDNCKSDAIDEVQALLVKRVAERTEYAKKTLEGKKFKYEPKTELVLDPDSRDYPKDTAEADKFQNKYLQFQISNYLATDMKIDEAKGNVVRNYERILKRVKETTQEDLFSNYLDAFGRALDPHSSFFSRDSLEDFEIQMGLSLEGIGATLSSQDGFTVVEQLIDGGSAKQSGLVQPQDKIVAVGQFKKDGEPAEMENVVEMDLRDVVRRIRGPKGTKVRLDILRKTAKGKERINITLVRDKIKLEEDAAQVHYLDKEVNGEKKKLAVMNLPSFYADARRGGRSSANDMKALLKEVREKKVDGLVLDLSTNGGGSLDDAVKIAGLFFKTGNVVKQSSRDPSAAESALDDKDPAVDWEGPLVVLTSRVSASASEIVAGTLKDYQRAVVVGGDHTFGKGSVQSVVQLPPGLGAVKVTVGMFFTPGGFSTQHRGVEADIAFPGAFSTDEIGEKHLDYSLPPKKIKSFVSPDAFVTTGPGAWKKIEDPWISTMKKNSQARVAKNEEFNKILADLKKAKEKGKVIKLSEAEKTTKEKKDEQESKKNLSKEAKATEYLKRADIQEAANILGDLIVLEQGPTARLTKTEAKPDEKNPVNQPATADDKASTAN